MSKVENGVREKFKLYKESKQQCSNVLKYGSGSCFTPPSAAKIFLPDTREYIVDNGGPGFLTVV
jgi:hypothetical protein